MAFTDSYIACTRLTEYQLGLNLSCVAHVANELRARSLPTAHILSIGGWDAPHVDTTLTGAQWWSVFEKWNREVVARDGFEGELRKGCEK